MFIIDKWLDVLSSCIIFYIGFINYPPYVKSTGDVLGFIKKPRSVNGAIYDVQFAVLSTIHARRQEAGKSMI